MAVATSAVVIMPALIVWWLHSAGVLISPWLCVAFAIVISLAASILGAAYWKRRGSGDVFFSELLLWGWLHRFRGERKLTNAAGRLGLGGDLDGQVAVGNGDVKQRARLLGQMAAALDAQDAYTDGHSRRVALHSEIVARKMGLERDEIAKVRTAAAVHDIGKLRIPPEVLNKPAALSEEEFEIVKRHADEGAAIVASMNDPEITAMVRHHHERFDGGGYPSGLVGPATPLGARIIAVADTFDALTSVRPYRKAIPHKRALEAIVGVSGTQLDPAVVRAFLRCYSGNRAVVFWTLLAAAPLRATAWLHGKPTGPANLASAATVATPAALAAVVATAFGSSSGLAASHPPFQPAPPNSLQAAGAPAPPKHHGDPKATAHPSAARGSSTTHKQFVLALRQTRSNLGSRSRRASGTVGGPAAGSTAGPGGGSRSGNQGTGGTGGTGGGHRTGKGAPPKHGTSKTPSPPTGVAVGSGPTAPSPTRPTRPPGGSGSGTPGAGGVTTSPTSTGPAAGSAGGNGGSGGSGGPGGAGGNGGSGGNGGNGGSGGSGGSGGGSGGSGGSSGGGSGGSGGGSGGPLTKSACMGGGYAGYGFPNQGQCVAYVERHSHR